MATTGMRGDMGNVTDISSARGRKPFGNSKPAAERRETAAVAVLPTGRRDDPPQQATDKPVRADTCFVILADIAPLNEKLKSMLQVPEMLYLGQGMSFTSEPGKYVDKLAAHFFMGTPMPESPELPQYGITRFVKGTSVFCLFIDQTRKIIVMDDVRDLMSSRKGSWDSFERSLDTAIRSSAGLPPGRFAVVREGVME